MFTKNATLVKGYNLIVLDEPISIAKGSIIIIDNPEKTVAVDSTDQSIVSDYLINGNRLKSSSNSRFYINAKIDVGYFLNQIKVSASFTDLGIYSISSSISLTSVNASTFFHVSNCKSKNSDCNSLIKYPTVNFQ